MIETKLDNDISIVTYYDTIACRWISGINGGPAHGWIIIGDDPEELHDRNVEFAKGATDADNSNVGSESLEYNNDAPGGAAV